MTRRTTDYVVTRYGSVRHLPAPAGRWSERHGVTALCSWTNKQDPTHRRDAATLPTCSWCLSMDGVPS